MRVFIANTDADWYRHLSRLAATPDGLDEANFWKPSGRANFKALSFGEPLVFKLKKSHGRAVVGLGSPPPSGSQPPSVGFQPVRP